MTTAPTTTDPLLLLVDVAPAVVVVPAGLLIGAMILDRFNRVWRILRFANSWGNPDNFVQLLAGQGLSLVAKDIPFVRQAALIVAMGNAVVNCLHQYDRLAKAYGSFIDSIGANYVIVPQVSFSSSHQKKILSPSMDFFVRRYWAITKIYLKNVALSGCALGRQTIAFGFACTETVDVLSQKKAACDRAVNELIVNSTNLLDKIAQHEKSTREILEANRTQVGSLLKLLGSKHSADTLINVMLDAMKTIQYVDQEVKEVTHCGNGVLVEAAKGVVFGATSLLGIPVPTVCMPSLGNKLFGKKRRKQVLPIKYALQPHRVRDGHVPDVFIQEIRIHIAREPTSYPPLRKAFGSFLYDIVFITPDGKEIRPEPYQGLLKKESIPVDEKVINTIKKTAGQASKRLNTVVSTFFRKYFLKKVGH